MKGEAGTGEVGTGAAAGAGMGVAAGTRAVAGTEAAGAGMGVAAGTAAAGMVAQDGEEPLPLRNSGMAGVGPGLPVAA
jgi:hypothetical protein